MVDRVTIACTISAYHQYSCEFEPRAWRCVLDTTLCDKVCQSLATGRWFSPDTPISYTNKTDRHDMTEILLKMALSTINQSSHLLGMHREPGIQLDDINNYILS